MTNEELIKQFSTLKIWKRGSHRAPHKPLLILFALAQFQRGNESLLFESIKDPISALIKDFSRYSTSVHPEYPFWRLQNDGIWELSNSEHVEIRKSNSDAKKSELIKYKVSGGFSAEIRKRLSKNSNLLKMIAKDLLQAHFPETWHEEIVNSLGLDIDNQVGSNARDPNFRLRILKAYQYTCAICGHSMHFGDRWPTLEAAHIKWFQANGPDTESNGLALCCNHHKLFDRGGVTLDEANKLLVSEDLHGTDLQEQILKYHGKPIQMPIRSEYVPSSEYTKWHRQEVFRGIAREN